ncbi:hypothetical protein SDC9_115746 [bioreactor metagenome]|uniref:Uncharacterized protein n=1 Tax=bioreactor metagenome TaxID=1076179 RepID=A0A645BU88_9ZZZZ
MNRFERVVDQKPRRVLFTQRNGILQIEHQRVAAVNMRVAHHAGVVARHKQHRPAEFHHASRPQSNAVSPVARWQAAVTRARIVQSSAPLSTALTTAYSSPKAATAL